MDLLEPPPEGSHKLSIDLNDDLNDDLAGSDYSGSIISHPSTQRNNQKIRKKNGTNSIRTSIDDSFLSSMFFQNIHDENFQDNEFSPLGANSIYELTIASDLSRERKRTTKYQVSLNGGNNVIYNVKTPTTKEIPPIILEKIEKPDKESLQKILDINDEYKKFDSSNKLTIDSLQQFNRNFNESPRSDSSINELDLVAKDTNEAIPEVFSQTDFRLDDPRIFNKVIGNFEIDTEISNFNNDLQDDLSHYLDLVEISLINEISKSSDSFFNTIDDIKLIQLLSNDNVKQFEKVKGQMKSLDSTNEQGLKILRLLEKRNEVDALEDSIVNLSFVMKKYEKAKSLFGEDSNKCLQELLNVEKMIYDYGFNSLPGLFNLQNDLQVLKNQCSKNYMNDFVDLLLEDLRDHYQNASLEDCFNRLYSKKKQPSYPYQVMGQPLKDELSGYIEMLIKSRHLAESFLVYQDKIISEIKDIIKIHLPKSEVPSRSSLVPLEVANPTAGNTTNEPSLTSSLKNLTPVEFEEMLIQTFTQLSECLRRLTVHAKVLLDLSLSNLTEDLDVMSLDLTVTINKAIELTQLRLSKIINVRSEQIADLTLPFYFSFYSIVSIYLQECELINPGYLLSGAGSSLNDWVKNHSNYFVHRFHLNHLKAISSDIDKEIWKEVGNLAQTQDLIQRIVEGEDHSDYLNYPFKYHNEEHKDEELLDKLTILGESFMVPNFIKLVVASVHDYITIGSIFTHHNKTIENNILNFFKLVNSKILQSVLNAGATRTAGLKHITTKHLALTIQTVECLIKFIELVMNKFDSNNEGDITFNKIFDLYKDHESQLSTKLVSIMYDRTINHCQSISTIDWSQPLPDPQLQCHKYMEVLVKETLTVSKVLVKYLSPVKYSIILSEIFNNYKVLLTDAYKNLPQFNDFNEKYSVLKDIDYLRVKLLEVPGYNEVGSIIWENVNNIPTIEDTKMDKIMRNNIEQSRNTEVLFETPKAVESPKAEESPKDVVKDTKPEQTKEPAQEIVNVKESVETTKPEELDDIIEQEILQAELQEKHSAAEDLGNTTISSINMKSESPALEEIVQEAGTTEPQVLSEIAEDGGAIPEIKKKEDNKEAATENAEVKDSSDKALEPEASPTLEESQLSKSKEPESEVSESKNPEPVPTIELVSNEESGSKLSSSIEADDHVIESNVAVEESETFNVEETADATSAEQTPDKDEKAETEKVETEESKLEENIPKVESVTPAEDSDLTPEVKKDTPVENNPPPPIEKDSNSLKPESKPKNKKSPKKKKKKNK